MRQESANPSANTLPPDWPENNLISAITESGYPLQSQVALRLARWFNVTEEHGFFDKVNNIHRSLDIHAYRTLTEHKDSNVSPSCSLLVECKKSHNPYVFFRNVTGQSIFDFPRVAGVSQRISICEFSQTNRRRSTETSVSRVLGLNRLTFVDPGPSKCATFSRAARKGKEIELSGTDPFNSIILPLVRALDHHIELRLPQGGVSTPLFPNLSLLVCVLDAPMILVETPDTVTEPILTPWVRVARREETPSERRSQTANFYAVDIIHVGYLDQYIERTVLPFCSDFSQRCVKIGNILNSGGEVPNLDAWEWNQVRSQVRGR